MRRSSQVATVVLREIGALLANCVAFIVAFFVGLRLVYPIVFKVFGRGSVALGHRPPLSEQSGMLLSIALAFIAVAGLTALWTRHVANVVVASATMYLLGMIILAEAMYLADGGDASMVWTYVKPRPIEYASSACVALVAVAGWYGVRRATHRAPRSA
jgi:hypothetical protein